MPGSLTNNVPQRGPSEREDMAKIKREVSKMSGPESTQLPQTYCQVSLDPYCGNESRRQHQGAGLKMTAIHKPSRMHLKHAFVDIFETRDSSRHFRRDCFRHLFFPRVLLVLLELQLQPLFVLLALQLLPDRYRGL